MITGDIKNQIDQIWNAFWSGGIANPLEVIEQITYLLFIRRLDDLHTLEENKANRLRQPMARRIFPEGNDARGRPYDDYRWSRFKHFAPADMFALVGEHLFPYLRADLARQLGNGDSTYAHHMKDARFTIPTPALLAKVVDLLDAVPMDERDTKGDVYEYMLAKIASAGQNGQFRTPRHIIRLMVEMTAPEPLDVICDPACGTAGFLVAAGEYLRERHPKLLHDAAQNEHFHHWMFHGFDFDNTMLRIGSMNMLLHGVESPDIRYRDSLAQDHAGEAEKYTLVLANPPFAGSLDYENTAKDLLQIVKTKKTELLFLALFLRLLKAGGRAAVIVPDGVLFGSSKAHKELRRMLVEDQKLDAVIKLPGGVFRPYAGVSTAILLFTKTNSGGTDQVWFYDVQADGWSLDDKRTPLLPEDLLGPVPARHSGASRNPEAFLDPGLRRGDSMATGQDRHPDAVTSRHSGEGRNPAPLTPEDHAKNNLPDLLARWRTLHPSPAGRGAGGEGPASPELARPRTAQSFCVPKADIAAQGYDLSLNRYKEVVHEAVEHRPPRDPGRTGAAGGGDSAGDEGVGGDVGVSRETLQLQEFCRIVQGGRLGLSGNDFVSDGFPAYGAGGMNGLLPTYEFDEPAVVLSAIGARCGKCFYGDGKWTSLANTQLIFPDAQRADPKFLWYQLNDERRWHRSGTGQPFIKPADVKAHRVFLPPLAEQKRIAAILDKADALRAKRRAALAQLDTLTQSIFLDMFGDPATNPKGWPVKEPLIN